MTYVTDLLDLMPDTVQISTLVGRDVYGAPQFGTPAAIRARVTYKPTLVRNWAGEQVVARGTVWAATDMEVSADDQVELPDGSTPPILSAERPSDEAGDRHLKVYFG